MNDSHAVIVFDDEVSHVDIKMYNELKVDNIRLREENRILRDKLQSPTDKGDNK